MSTSTISSTTIQLYQYTTNINQTTGANSATSGSSISGVGSGHQHGGGEFLKNVLQSLQSLGLNLPTANPGGTTAAGSADSDGNNDQNGVTISLPGNVQQALHTFLHDLHQALTQAGAQLQTTGISTTDSNGDNGGSPASGIQSGYSNFNSNLSSLINSLNNNSGGNGTLQTDFSNLVQALGGSSTNPNLTVQNFLHQLQTNANNNNSSLTNSSNILQIRA